MDEERIERVRRSYLVGQADARNGEEAIAREKIEREDLPRPEPRRLREGLQELPSRGRVVMPGPIAVKLRDLRVKRGLSHKQAAGLANVTPKTLIDLERGKRPPYMPTVTKLARAYGVRVEELVEEE